MSADDLTLTPTSLRILSVPATPGGGPAAPLKGQIRTRSHPAPRSPRPHNDFDEVAANGVSETSGPRNLSSAFDAVATNADASLDRACSTATPLDYNDIVDENQSHSLSLPLSQAPVTPDALPKASVSVRANALCSVDDQPDAAPAETPIREGPKPDVGALAATDKAEICPPSPPQSLRPVKERVPSKETMLGMYQGATSPHDESERLRTVALLGILDQPEDPVLSSITKLVTRLLKVSTVGEQSSLHVCIPLQDTALSVTHRHHVQSRLTCA